MKNFKKIRHNSGFTMLEMLIIVGITVILLGVSMASVAPHRDSIDIAELDNVARDIYMAAENRAVLLTSSLRLETLVKGTKADGTAVGKSVVLKGKCTAFPDVHPNNPDNKEELYYVSKEGIRNTDLLTLEGIDPTLSDPDTAHDFYIVYDVYSGSVTDVFYSRGDTDSDGKTLGDYVNDANFEDFYENWSISRDDRLKKKKDHGKILVGWYNGAAAKGEAGGYWPDAAEPQFSVEIVNGEELTVTLKVWGEYVEKLADGSAGLEVRLGPANLTDEELVDGDSKELPVTIPTDASDSFEKTWVVDSLRPQAGEWKFAKLVERPDPSGPPYVTPGNDFKVVATITDPDSGTYYRDDTDNSLFWTVDKGTAYIKYLRHLQNLDATGNYQSGVAANTTITQALQIDNINGNGNQTVDLPDGSNAPIYKDYNFIPIVNDSLNLYNGQYNGDKKTINELYINHEADNQGLFGSTASTCNIQNVTLMDGSIKGGSKVGGIVGENKGTVQDCSFLISTTNVKTVHVEGTGSYVGGIVGFNTGENAVVRDCSNAATVGDTSMSGQTVGGIVGLNANNAKVEGTDSTNYTKSQNTGMVYGKEFVGGIVGQNESGAMVYGYMNRGNVTGTVGNEYWGGVGGIVGFNSSTAIDKTNNLAIYAVDSCQNSGNVTSKETVTGFAVNTGGVAGYNSGSVRGCVTDSATITIKGNYTTRVGGIVGFNTGENAVVQDCSNGATVGDDKSKSGTSVGGIVGLNANNAKVEGTDKKVEGTDEKDYTNRRNTGYVYGTNNVGGIVGANESGAVVSLYMNEGVVTGNGQWWGGIGGVVGYNNGENSVVRDCSNKATVLDIGKSEGVGGIVGWNNDSAKVEGTDPTNFTNSKNTGEVRVDCRNDVHTTKVGGIVGRNDTNCMVLAYKNEGVVIGSYSGKRWNTWDTEGIGGIVGSNLSTATVTDTSSGTTIYAVDSCVNSGDMNQSVNGSCNIGGVVGYNNGAVNKCYNIISIGTDSEGSKNYCNVGGIVGRNHTTGTVRNCHNGSSGVPIKISGDGSVGGIAGVSQGNVGVAAEGESCTNHGSVTGYNAVGGIVGSNSIDSEKMNDPTVDKCTNYGAVTGTVDAYAVGGIVGSNSGTVKDSTNKGPVSGGEEAYQIGGIVGYNSMIEKNGEGIKGGEVTGCGNISDGAVKGNESVGGVVGYQRSGNVEACYNTQNVEGSFDVGGIAGDNYNGYVKKCYNTGNVKGTGNDGDNYTKVGGVVGENGGDGDIGPKSGTVENCYNTGEVSGLVMGVGGVVGNNANGSTVTACYNTGKVYYTGGGPYESGGVVGINVNNSTSHCYFLWGTAVGGIGWVYGNEILAKDYDGQAERKDAGEFASLFSGFDSNVWKIETFNGKTLLNRPVLINNNEVENVKKEQASTASLQSAG